MAKSFRNLFPRASDYRELKSSWRADLIAGVTVGIVALPLALAFAVSSGVGAEVGLVTAIVAGIVAAVFGGSNVQVSGPTGAMVVVLAPIVAAHGPGAVATVSVLAGAIVLLAGLLRLGRTVSYIPWPVIEGFTAGIGVIIFMQQVPAALGLSSRGLSTNAVAAAWQAVRGATWPDALLSVAVVAAVAALMLVLARFAPRLPGSFLALLIVSVAVIALGWDVQTIGELPKSLPAPSMPPMSPEIIAQLMGPALAVAALAAIESLLSARVAATLADTGSLQSDRELVGQGLASIASGVFGGMPATGAIARTAVNVRAGARTRFASIAHGLLLLVVVLAAGGIVSKIPLAALSGVLMVTAARMVGPSTIARVFRSGTSSAVTFVVTFAITVAFDLIIAVGIGVVVAAVAALRALSRASNARREPLPGERQPGDERIALMTMTGSLFFGASERLTEQIEEEREVSVVIIRLSRVQLIDATGANALAETMHALERRGVTVLIKGVRPEHRKLLQELGVIDSLTHPNHLFAELEPAIEHARNHVARTA